MTTLDDAWHWYQSARNACLFLTALGDCWNQFPWETAPRPNNRIQGTEAVDLTRMGEAVYTPLDDLAVLVLFSVFEAIVRHQVERQLRPEIARLEHVALKSAAEDVLHAVEDGSFYRVLEPFKKQATNDLVEQVNQVRRYRNWVAHGRRADKHPGADVQPHDAYERLKSFLGIISSASAELASVA